MSANLEEYTRSLTDNIQRGAHTIQIDKEWVREEFVSLTAGLQFFHHVFVRMSLDLGLRFVIYTAISNPQRFNVIFYKMEKP